MSADSKPRETQIEDLIAEILRPAIDVRAPYAKQMIIALRKLFVESALLREEAPPIEIVRQRAMDFAEGYRAGYADGLDGNAEDSESAWCRSKASAELAPKGGEE